MALIEFKDLPDETTPATSNDINNNFLYTVPTGGIVIFGGTNVPKGWLLCNGQAVSRTTYRELFDVIGIAFGSGNGSTTFNLPKFDSMVPIGKDSTDTHFNVLGKTYGEKTHTMTINELVSHNHEMNLKAAGQSNPKRQWGVPTQEADNMGDVSTNYSGSGTPFNIIQPSIVVNYIIKT